MGGMIEQVTDQAAGVVDNAEQSAMSSMGKGSKLLSGFAGSSGSQSGQAGTVGDGKGQEKGADKGSQGSGGKSQGGGDFLSLLKSGVHTRLMTFGLMNIRKLGAKVIVAGTAKVTGVIKKMLTPKVKFKLGAEEHELWVEKGKNRNVVMMASGDGSDIHMHEEVDKQMSKDVKSEVRELEQSPESKVTQSRVQKVAYGLEAGSKGEGKDRDEVPETLIEHGGIAGTQMWVEANPLTQKGPAGFPPKESCPGWEHAQDLNKVQDSWVKGHLLNHHLHGPGVAWNLVPLNKKNNSAMAVGPEELAKSMFKEKVLYYRTDVLFHSGKEPVMYFPKTITISVGEKINNKIINKKTYSLDQEKPPESVENVTYNINEIGREFLRDKFGIPEIFAKEIIYVRDKYGRKAGENGKGRFDNFYHLQDLMDKYYTNKLDTNTKFTEDKLNSFDNNLIILEQNILKDKKLEVK